MSFVEKELEKEMEADKAMMELITQEGMTPFISEIVDFSQIVQTRSGKTKSSQEKGKKKEAKGKEERET